MMHHCVGDLSDFNMSLRSFQKILSRLITQYGPDARIQADAGTNNVTVFVVHPAKQIQNKPNKKKSRRSCDYCDKGVPHRECY